MARLSPARRAEIVQLAAHASNRRWIEWLEAWVPETGRDWRGPRRVAAARLGGLARAAALSPARRRAIARLGGRARWARAARDGGTP